MHETLKNLYYVTLFALLMQFIGLREPFYVLFGITLLYLAVAELFMADEIDRMRRMYSFSYKRRPDVSIAFIAMTACFGLLQLATGLHFLFRIFPLLPWLQGIGSLGALYVFLHPYLPDPDDRRRRRLRSIR